MKKIVYPLLFAAIVLGQTACQKTAFKNEAAGSAGNERSMAFSRKELYKIDSTGSKTIFSNQSLDAMRIAAASDQEAVVKKISDIVAPVVADLRKQMEAEPDIYKGYQVAIKAIADAKTFDEKKSKADYVSKAYYPFIKKIWEEAKVDEPYYQSKIREVFPASVRDMIRFDEFLRFQLIVQNPVQPYSPGGSSEPPVSTPPISKPDDPNPFLCVSAIPTSFFLFDNYKSGIGTGSHRSDRNFTNTGSPYCGLDTKTDTQGPWGSRSEIGITLDSFHIPGRFPLDSRRLQSTLVYDWGGTAYATSVLGTSLASYYETPVFEDQLEHWRSSRTICSPVTFVMFSMLNEDATFTSPLSTKQAGKVLVFGYGAANLSSASGIAFAGATSYAETMNWKVCEMP
ncbi:hypothetical protein LQ567_08720 [Niabella pedocola]|uniref:Uncharacterized protein n=1 Tax=Niabella pedocola TaxID=1752077 RepID=A0ABS8PP26_9BACT|nr:hypothetical protein [Niabella pedocola]MCD2422840.1 hypothetical protein [Niabella pedocola]